MTEDGTVRWVNRVALRIVGADGTSKTSRMGALGLKYVPNLSRLYLFSKSAMLVMSTGFESFGYGYISAISRLKMMIRLTL